MAASLNRQKYPRLLIVAVFLSLLSIYNFYPTLFGGPRPFYNWTKDAFPHAANISIDDGSCDIFRSPIAKNVQIILKTGAAEAYDKLLVHLATVTSCIPPSDLLILSDLDEQLGSWHLHDALSSLPEAYRASNPEFRVYTQQKEYRQARMSMKSLKGGWTLDKYKFLPMMEVALKEHPDKQWYFFLEADTFVVWENFFYWISHLDPDEPMYLGSPVWPKGKPTFAHGGSGFVLSHAALVKFQEEARNVETSEPQFGVDMTKECCGDEVLAQVLHRMGIDLHGYWPMFNGEKPNSVRFGNEQWCEPVITMHHLNQEDTAQFWAWVRDRNDMNDVSFVCCYYGDLTLSLSDRVLYINIF